MAHSQSPARRKLYTLCKELALTREERLEWATYQLRRDITSFDALDEDQVGRLLDGIEGFSLLSVLIDLRGPSLGEEVLHDGVAEVVSGEVEE